MNFCFNENILSNETAKNLFDSGWTEEEIDKYFTYLCNVRKKNQFAKHGKTARSDSQRNKTYQAEWKFWDMLPQRENLKQIRNFNDIEEAQKRCAQIEESATWKKVARCRFPIRIREKKTRGNSGNLGFARSDNLIALRKGGGNEYVLLHEMAHCAGFRHHDAGFRYTLLKLVSAFIGKEQAKMLKHCFKDKGLKTTMPKAKEAKTPEQWLVMHRRMEKARAARAA